MRRKLARCILAVVLAAFVCLSPYVDAKRAYAFAPAIPAGAAAAALAAELGISTEALMAGTLALFAGGTGVYLLNNQEAAVSLPQQKYDNLWNPGGVMDGGAWSDPANWDNDYQNYKMPGVDQSWNDLSQEQKDAFGSPAGYVGSQFVLLHKLLGITRDDGNGGLEPTPEPDKNTNPDGNAKWQKARNVLTLLGVSGAAVGLSAAADVLGDAIEGGISSLVLKDEGFGLPYSRSYVVNDVSVQFSTYNLNYNYADGYRLYGPSDWAVINNYDWSNGYHNDIAVTVDRNDRPVASNIVFNIGSNGYYETSSRYTIVDIKDTASFASSYFGVNEQTVLNAVYHGTYKFGDSATYSGGLMVGEYEDGLADYGQMDGTPSGYGDNILNNTDLVNYINNYSTDGLEAGQQRAVVVPTIPAGQTPTYSDYVIPLQDEYVTPVPDDGPVTKPDPKPQPGPTPSPSPGGTKPDDWDDDYTQTVNHLLSTPFDQLFPFCLIADFRDFTFLLLSGQSGGRLQPGQINTQSSIPTDQLNGVHTLRLDFSAAMEDFVTEIPLDPLHTLLGYTRFTLTCLLIMAVVYESFGFFLKRGA